MTDNKEDIRAYLYFAVFFAVAAFIFGYHMAKKHFREHTKLVTDTVVVERWDTVRIVEPTEVVRYVTRHDTIKLFENPEQLKPTIIDDSTVVVPIECVTYKDSTENAAYTAYVSGYRAALDSIIIDCKNTETIITNTITVQPRRIGFGLQCGVGFSPKGLATPYLGVGVHYRLW